MGKGATDLAVLPWDLTSFVGRAAERARLRAVIAAGDRARVVGLFGIAGVGKSRLARVVATEDAAGPLAEHLPGGVAWCAGDIDAVAAAVAPPGDEPAIERVAAALVRRERSLIVIDCPGPAPDELVEALGAWLSAGDHMFLLCARFPIALRGAVRVEIGPLDSDAAAALLIDRCRDLDVALDAGSAAELAAAAGGLPLAVELCAGALAGESPEALVERLRGDAGRAGELTTDDRDVPARHRSLEAAFADTWRHLEPGDRAALAIAASFAGAFSRDDFAAVAARAEPSARLERATRRGLVMHDGDRYDLLRLLRALIRAELGAEEAARLDRARAEAVADRCAEAPLAATELLAAARVLGRAGVEHPALARALIEVARRARRSDWRLAGEALELARQVGAGDPQIAGLAAAATAELARLRGDRVAARAALDSAAAAAAGSARERVEALLALDRGALDDAQRHLDSALASASSPRERAEILAARFGVALASDGEAADDDGAAAYELFREVGAHREAAVALINLGLAALNRGELALGRARLERAEAEGREAGEGAAIVAADLFRGLAALADGDPADAVEPLGRAEKGALELASPTVWSDAVGYGAVARHLAGVSSARAELASHVDELARRGRGAAWALFAAFLARIDDARPAPPADAAAGRPLVRQTVELFAGVVERAGGLSGRIARRVIDAGGAAPVPPGAVELQVSADCRRFRAGDVDGDLRRRGPLGRIFEALVGAVESGGGALSAEQLIDAGWPGEVIGAESARTRLYNAVASLRQMGLRGLLVTTGDGYRLEGAQVRRTTEMT